MIIIGSYVFNKNEIIMIYNDKNMDLQNGIRIVFKDRTLGDIFVKGYNIKHIEFKSEVE